MRGIVSAAMTAALERASLRDSFDLVVGCSAGALNAAAFLSGDAEASMREYWGAFGGRGFINLARVLARRPAVNLELVVDYASETLDARRHERTFSSPIELHCIATNVDSGESEDLNNFQNIEELRAALLASSRLPALSGPPVVFRGRRYLDGGISEPIPLRTAMALGATHLLLFLTRPAGALYPTPRGLQEVIVNRALSKLNPHVCAAYRSRAPRYDALTNEIAERERSGHPPPLLAIRPPPDLPIVRRLERDRGLLEHVASSCLSHAESVILPGMRQIP